MSQLCDPLVLLSPPRLPGVPQPGRAELLCPSRPASLTERHQEAPRTCSAFLNRGRPAHSRREEGLPAGLGRGGGGALRLELTGPPGSRRVLAKQHVQFLSPEPVSLHRRGWGRGCPTRHFPGLPPLGPRSPAPSLLRSAPPRPPQSPGPSCEHQIESLGLWGHTCRTSDSLKPASRSVRRGRRSRT